MADKVGLKEAEYSSLTSKLGDAHDKSISEAKGVLCKLKGLNSESGGFHTKDMSKKISTLSGAVESILERMSELYSTHESIVESFQTAINNYDVD